MISVTKIVVRSFDLDHLDIFWEIDAVKAGVTDDLKTHEIFDYQFFVSRSEAGAGPFIDVGGPFRDPTYTFRDNRVSLLSKWRSFYYKIRVLHVPTGKTAEFGPVSNSDPEPDRVAMAVRFEEDVLFREFIGRKCWLFPVRTFGPRCTCWDPIAARRTRSNHRPCFGTGWLGGFLYPVECFVQIDPTTNAPQLTSLTESQQNVTRGRMMSFPPVKPRDILVESENRRWRVESVSNTQRLRAPLHQELTLSEIARGEVEYELPVNIDAKSLQPAAERNFTNPPNLESSEDFHDIIALYGIPRGSG